MGWGQDQSSIGSNESKHKKRVAAQFEVFGQSWRIDHDEESSVESQENESAEEREEQILNLHFSVFRDEVLEAIDVLNDWGKSK